MGESAFRKVLFHYKYNTVFIIGQFHTTEIVNYCVVNIQEQECKLILSLPSDADEMWYLMKGSSNEYDDSNYVFISKDDNDRTFILKRVRRNIFRDIKTDLNTNVLKFCVDALSEAERADEAVMHENWEKFCAECAYDDESQNSPKTVNCEYKQEDVQEKGECKCSGKQTLSHLRKKQRRRKRTFRCTQNSHNTMKTKRKH